MSSWIFSLLSLFWYQLRMKHGGFIYEKFYSIKSPEKWICLEKADRHYKAELVMVVMNVNSQRSFFRQKDYFVISFTKAKNFPLKKHFYSRKLFPHK